MYIPFVLLLWIKPDVLKKFLATETVDGMVESKFTWCFGVHFVANMICQNLMNTGAFEIYFEDELVWSKLATGRLPTWPELTDGLESITST